MLPTPVLLNPTPVSKAHATRPPTISNALNPAAEKNEHDPTAMNSTAGPEFR